jgi:hypothetical protein
MWVWTTLARFPSSEMASSASEDMIDTRGGEIMLGLQRRRTNVPGVLLKRFPGRCSASPDRNNSR